MRKISLEQPPVDTPPRLSGWLTRLVSSINGSIEVNQYPAFKKVEGNTSTQGSQVVICKNTTEIDVTLELNPPIGTVVHIKRRDAVVNVIGTIDGLVNKTINLVNYSMHLYFDGIDWSEI